MHLARALLVADAFGCAGTAASLAALPGLLHPVDPRGSTRWPIVSALVLTAAVCADGARRPVPSPGSLHRAAAANAGWVLVCGAAIPGRRDAGGRALVVATGVLDAVMGAGQWSLARRAARAETLRTHV